MYPINEKIDPIQSKIAYFFECFVKYPLPNAIKEKIKPNIIVYTKSMSFVVIENGGIPTIEAK